MNKEKNLNIMQVVHSMDIAGAETLVCSIVRELREEKFSFSICCLDYIGRLGHRLIKEGFDVFCLDRRPGVDVTLIGKLAKILKDKKIDIIHAHQYTPYFYAAFASILYRKRGVIFTEHGRHQPDYIRPKRVVCNKVLNLATSKITGVSRFSKDSLVRYEKLPSKKIEVIYNGVDAERFNAGFDKIAKRMDLGLTKTDIVLGMVARFAPIKNHRMLLTSFAEVLRNIPNAKLLLVGDGELKGNCERLAVKLGIEKRVTFLGRRDDIPGLLSIFDIYVLSSIAEATSFTLLEAMAAGLPVVAVKAGGNPEIVINGETGILTPTDNPAEFARAVVSLINNSEKRRQMGEAGSCRARFVFNKNKMLDRYETLYLKSGRINYATR